MTKYKLCEIETIDGKEFISDYRLGHTKAQYIKGRLKDLDEWFLKSFGLGDLLGSFKVDSLTLEEKEKLTLVKYNGASGSMYALGIMN